MSRIALLIACVLTCTAAFADIAPDPLITGGATLSGKNIKGTPVAMTYEEVDLRPSAARNDVTAIFTLKNTADAETTLEVGFPSYNEIPLKDFTVEIDGAKVKPELKKEVQKVGGPQSHKTFTLEWATWPMTFAAAAEHKVKVTYWVPPQRQFRWSRHEVINGRPTSIVDELVNPDKGGASDEAKLMLPAYSSGYVLRTGAGWHGKIGKAVIRLHHGEQAKKDLMTIGHGDAKDAKWLFDEKANTSTLTLVDFEPTEMSDIAYNWRLCTGEQEKAIVTDLLLGNKLDVVNRMVALRRILRPKEHNKPLPANLEGESLALVEHLVPPIGGPLEADRFFPRLEDEIRTAFERLMAHYKDKGDKAKAAALAEAYGKFIDDLTAGLATRYDAKYASQRKAFWAGHKKAVQQYADEMKAAKE